MNICVQFLYEHVSIYLESIRTQHGQILCSGSHKAEIKVAYELSFCLEALEEKICFQDLSCWQSSAPCGCSTEVPTSLLAVIQEPLSVYRGYSHSLLYGPLHFPAPFVFKKIPFLLNCLYGQSDFIVYMYMQVYF